MKITEHFSKSEFDSKDGADMPYDVYCRIAKLCNQLEVLRKHLNAPIRINSGYRSPSHNKKVGGSPHSQHLLGNAADIVVSGFTPLQVANEIEKLIANGDMLQGGLGKYKTFTHYDIRGKKARWDFSK